MLRVKSIVCEYPSSFDSQMNEEIEILIKQDFQIRRIDFSCSDRYLHGLIIYEDEDR